MIWPIALVVFSNIVYQICAKGVPKDMDAMASMTITYLVGAVCSAIMYFVMNKNGNLLQEYAKMNWAPFFSVSLWLDWRSVLFMLIKTAGQSVQHPLCKVHFWQLH